jgi:ABC-type phosphate transport system auxiliary subunit
MDANATPEESRHEKALWWALKLGEKKVHVVHAVLSLVGDLGVRRLFDEAVVLHATGTTLSLGGAFMRGLQKVVINGTTLYQNANALSGEDMIARKKQRERVRLRNIANRSYLKL